MLGACSYDDDAPFSHQFSLHFVTSGTWEHCHQPLNRYGEYNTEVNFRVGNLSIFTTF